MSDEQMRDEAAPDPALVDAWKALRASRAVQQSDGADALLDTAFDDTRPESEREAALLKALDGGHGDALAMAHAMREAAREATHRESVPAHAPRGWARWKSPVMSSAAFLAAAAVLFIAVRTFVPQSTDLSTMRGGDPTFALRAPATGATISDSTRFSWEAVREVSSYTITWFDSAGLALGHQAVAVPQATLNSDVAAQRARIASWQVEAVTLDGRRIKSAIQPLARP